MSDASGEGPVVPRAQQSPGPQPVLDSPSHTAAEPSNTAAEPSDTVGYVRRSKKRIGLIAGLGAGVLLLLIVAGVAGAMASASHAPERQVAAYLGALENGHATEALRLSGLRARSTDILLTDAAYRAATDRITHSVVETTVVNGDAAAVTARITQGGKHYTQTFTLDKVGTDLLLFPVWQLEPVQLGAVQVRVSAPADASLTVAGITAPAGQTLQLAALPGTYAVAGTDSKWFSVNRQKAVVAGFGAAGSTPVSVTATLTKDGEAAATTAVQKYLDGCVASTEFLPPNCSFGATGQDPAYTYTNQKWTLTSRPVFTIGAWSHGGWAVTTVTPGSATFTADISGPNGQGTSSTDPIPVSVVGAITKIDGSGATFQTVVVGPATA